MRYITVLLASLLLATVTLGGVSTVVPKEAEAAYNGYVKTCAGDKMRLNLKEKRTLALHNKTRKDRGLKPLCVDRTLTKAARFHSKEMIKHDYFSHDSYNGKTYYEDMVQRLQRLGYKKYQIIGENVAMGSGSKGSPDSIHKAWMKSTPHRKNILKASYRQIGIGAVTGTYEEHKDVTMYTADFGTRR